MNSPTGEPGTPVLKGERLLLRPTQESDKTDRLAYGRDLEFRRMVGGDPNHCPPLTLEEVELWYARVRSEPLHWVIEFEGHCIGTASLRMWNRENRRARYTIGIFAPRLWGKGLGTETTRLVLTYAFDVLHLHRVDLRVLAFNQRAIACYEKCGFVREGIEREGERIGDAWVSDIWMSILEHEYFQRKAAEKREPAPSITYEISPEETNEALNALFGAAWPKHQQCDFQPTLTHSLAYICAYASGRLIGFVNLAWEGDVHAFLLDTTVHPEFQRRGIGQQLVRKALEIAQQRGIEWVHVDFEPYLRDFYSRCGFQPTEAGLYHCRP